VEVTISVMDVVVLNVDIIDIAVEAMIRFDESNVVVDVRWLGSQE